MHNEPLTGEEKTEIQVVQPAGGQRFAELHILNVTWDDRPGLLTCLRDVIERKENEIELQHLNSVLRHSPYQPAHRQGEAQGSTD